MHATGRPVRTRSRILRLSAPLLAALTLLLAGCGGGGSDGDGGSKSTKGGGARGRTLFTQRCGACHTLADAGTAGAVGPNLDDLGGLDEDRVRAQIDIGGGGMPPDLVEGKDADAVARYVASAAGS